MPGRLRRPTASTFSRVIAPDASALSSGAPGQPSNPRPSAAPPLVGSRFMTTKPARFRCLTRRLATIVDVISSALPQRECQRVGDVFGRCGCGRQGVAIVWHGRTVADRREQRKNKLTRPRHPDRSWGTIRGHVRGTRAGHLAGLARCATLALRAPVHRIKIKRHETSHHHMLCHTRTSACRPSR